MTLRILTISTFCVMVMGCWRPQATPRNVSFVEGIEANVSRLRQLPFLHPIQIGEKNDAAIRRYLESRLSEEYRPGELEDEELVLELFELIPHGYPYKEKMLELLTQEIAAYYDPFEDTLFLSHRVPTQDLEQVVAHELVHGLQGQHFRLKEWMQKKNENDDAMLALNALIEGDAVVVMLLYALETQKQTNVKPSDLRGWMTQQLEKKSDIPSFLRKSLAFPYLDGMSFIEAVRDKSDWKGVDKVYENLPKSTEQILHPEKYLTNVDLPIEVKNEKDVLMSQRLTSNVIGEFGIYLLLSSSLSETEARVAAEGWGGDRYWLSKGEAKSLVWKTVWDSEAFAARFAKALRKARPKWKKITENKNEVRVTLTQ